MTQSYDPFEVLLREHELGLSYLEKLRSAALNIGEKGFSPGGFLELSETIRTIQLFLRTHNEQEELYLFPLLERHASPLPRTLKNERKEIMKLICTILQCVDDIEEARIYATTVKEMLRASEQLYQLLRSQIAKENETVFPAARKLLTQKEYRLFSEQIAAAPSFREAEFID